LPGKSNTVIEPPVVVARSRPSLRSTVTPALIAHFGAKAGEGVE
jgi:hypothetical protein